MTMPWLTEVGTIRRQYHKVKPLLNLLRDACLLTEAEERMSVDEPLQRKNSLRVRNGASNSWQDVV